MCDEKEITLDLYCSKKQLENGTVMSEQMCMNLYEYIRRCVDAHTNILKKDSFGIVPHYN